MCGREYLIAQLVRLVVQFIRSDNSRIVPAGLFYQATTCGEQPTRHPERDQGRLQHIVGGDSLRELRERSRR